MSHNNSPSARRGKIIAIDGPAGSGKSTTAKLVAAKLGYQYLDTGAMYRAVTLLGIRQGVSPSDGDRLTELSLKIQIRFETTSSLNRVFVNDEEVTQAIRTPEITTHVSEVSAHAGVRRAMVAKQQEIGRFGSIVAEGRDTTTVVFPDAEIKVFLKASVDARANRRLLEFQKMHVSTTVAEQAADLERRDAFDSGRQHSPLTQAPDAVVIDTTNLTIEEQVAKILELAQKNVTA